MDYLQFDFKTDPRHKDTLLAYLEQLPFDSFVETEEGWQAFIPLAAEAEKKMRSAIEQLTLPYAYSLQVHRLAGENWNARWEAEFQPVQVSDFCGIRASFHAPISGVKHELIIDPKMAFGTGHHETTSLVIACMARESWANTAVLDFGCGTGILAILASRLGAREVLAIDIEEAAVENALENCRLNQCPDIRVRQGGLEAIPLRSFDRILANINRNVILDSLPALYQRLASGGLLFISGFYEEDLPLLLEKATATGFVREEQQLKNNWVCLQLRKAA